MRIGLFPTCLVRHFRPGVARCAEEVLRRLGHDVVRVDEDGCCGQPAHSAGSAREAEEVGGRWVRAVAGEDLECLVIPSGSCTSMVRNHLAHYLRPHDQEAASLLAARAYEFSEFLVEVLQVEDVGAACSGRAAYHASCHLLRELGVRSAPMRLLKRVKGLRLAPMEKHDECCGFGGVFSVLFPEVSSAMTRDKVQHFKESGARTLILNDMGCLLQIEGVLKKQGVDASVFHLAEVLAGQVKEAHG